MSGAELSGVDEAGAAGQAAACLLSLPHALLAVILGRLGSAADLLSAAASCRTLRAVVAGGQSWEGVESLTVQRWSPALACTLRWAAAHCPRLRAVSLQGAAPCCEADLLPLTQLSTLTSLSLAGLHRVQGIAPATGGTGARRGGGGSPPAHALSALLGSNPGLLELDLSGTAVPIGPELAAALRQLRGCTPDGAAAQPGLRRLSLAGCGGGGGGGEALLGEVLMQCPALTSLDLAGCRWLTDGALPVPEGEQRRALERLPLRSVSLADCELLGGVGWLLSGWHQLTRLDLAGSGVGDDAVQAAAAACPRLAALNLSRCVRIRGPALWCLAASASAQSGALTELRLADLAWPGEPELGALLGALGAAAGRRGTALRLDLSSCGGLGDASLLRLVDSMHSMHSAPLGPQAPRPAEAAAGDSRASSPCRGSEPGGTLAELRVGGGSRLTGGGLLELTRARHSGGGRQLLRGCHTLDLSHTPCLGGRRGGGPAAPGSAPNEARQALAALLEAAGRSLRSANLDGCSLGGGLLPLLAASCPGVTALSLVGCTGLADADLAAAARLPALRDLAVGGASLAWHEHRALTGLAGLTRLRIARRPFLTDAQLAPLLAANAATLRQLELAGCAALSDAALLHLLPPPQDGAVRATEALCAAEAGQDADAVAAILDGCQQAAGQAGEAEQQGEELREPQRRQPPPGPPPPLHTLHLVCCERMRGATLRRLRSLRALHLSGSAGLDVEAVQAAAVCLTRLTRLQLPGHIPRSAVPVAAAAAASHLPGLAVVGGMEERGSGRGRSRRRG